MRNQQKKAKIVGCGLSGITAAILLKEKGYDVTIYETRNHIGGNCYDSNVAGTLVHNYGPHYFHTNDEEVFEFLSRYTEWFNYRYKPKGNTKLGLISLPYSKKTIRELGRELTQEEIVDVIFKDYSEKQWGVPFVEIPKSITNRIPKTKDDEDPSWFKDEKYQCMPKEGYTKMMERMLEGIDVVLNCDTNTWKTAAADLVVYTGKIDEYFNYCYGYLLYRSLTFKHTFTKDKMDVAAINQNTAEVPFTRIYDHSHCMFKHKGNTIITEEYPKQWEEGDVPFYPMPFGEGIEIYNKYKELADKEKNVVFIGRLATYTYLDMWMSIKQTMLKIKAV
jgi:UDP-galactopyranose mutase